MAALNDHEKLLVRSEDNLDDYERMALYVIGQQALHYAFGREFLNGEGNGDGLGWLFALTTKAIREATPWMGDELWDMAQRKRKAQEGAATP